MKSVLISIRPYWVFLIIARLMGWNIPQEKTIEIRKDYPKASDWNKVVHIYCSKNRKSFNRIPKEYQPFMEKLLGKVIGSFVCDRIDKYCGRLTTYAETPYKNKYVSSEELAKTCLTIGELNDYLEGKNGYFGNSCFWHISDLKIYDTTKDLNEFSRYGAHIRGGCCIKGNCKHYISNGYFEPPECSIEGCIITRPPQSWGYVEEL